ncbi:putative MATE family efflux protein [Sphingomonas naasensis]|uniref:MATE family efflux transporter n=1 Tax=Sphingomonas naasensis TaxID=1344951 RepID=A0A4V3QXA7_9SPHN|nr:MATE family efflux transporter [Sphingomonas naasensis]NIJ18497.1 putative MATE family efflux protein [Sphingomonas naasensis]TGX45752.1 MATE family efflux transporter [Sphingomonas naasensis]
MPAPRRDLTQGNISRALLLFALPTLGSNILQSLNGSINAVWVGRFLGEDALAATSNANIIMFLLFGIVFGFGMAATVLVGQAMGRRDLDSARRAFGSAIGLVAIGAALVAGLGWVFAPRILDLLATPAGAMPLALAYMRVIFLAAPAGMLMTLIMMGLRGVGDAMTPLWFMVVNVVLDAGLNPVFILGLGGAPRMGIAGSAMATVIANYATVIGLVAIVYLRDLPVRLRGRELGYLIPARALMRTIVAKGLPMGAQMFVLSFAGLTMVGLVNRLGVETAAAYGVSQQLWTYIQMPAMAVGAAVSAMAAQNIGAGAWDRVAGITRAGILYTLLLTGTMVAAVLLFDRPVMELFLGGDSPALPIARHIQLISSWNFMLFGLTMVLFATVRANGAVLMPLAILGFALYPVRIGFALALQPALGADALWWSFPVSSAVALLLAAAYYRSGHWKKAAMAPIAPEQAEEEALAGGEPAGRLQPTG